MNKQKIYSILLILLAVGTPGLLKFDQSGLTQEFGLFNINSIARIILYLIVGALFLFIYLMTMGRKGNSSNSFVGLRIAFILYTYFLFVTPLSVSGTSLILAVYRICEWILLILVIAAATPRETYTAPNSDPNRYIVSILMPILSLPAIIVLIGTVVWPEMAINFDPIAGIIRLGGGLFGPNILGLACGMGCLVFWQLSRTWVGRIWGIVLFGCMILAYSRGAYVGFVASILIGWGFFGTTTHRFILGFVTILISAVLLFYIDQIFEALLLLAIRGQDVENVASASGRTFIWEAAIRAIIDEWLVGRGFIIGPRVLPVYLNMPWFNAPTAHNDILNAAMSGGVIAGALASAFYVVLGLALIAAPIERRYKQVFVMISIQAFIYSVLTPLLSITAAAGGAIMLIMARHAARMQDRGKVLSASTIRAPRQVGNNVLRPSSPPARPYTGNTGHKR